jgi:hypothetical protein
LRKTAAFILGVLLSFTIGYYVLHTAFWLIANWLGPVLGSSLLPTLILVFLILGEPLKFMGLVAIWGGASLLGGVIVRRRVGAVLTMVSVFLISVLLLLTNALGLALNMSALISESPPVDPLDLIPPLPSGLTIAQLYEAPIIGELMEYALGMMATGPPEDIQSVLMDLATPLLVSVAEKLIIVILAALIGVEVGKRMEPYLKPYSDSLKVKLGGGNKPGGGLPDVEKILAFLSLLLLVGTILPASLGAWAADESFYTENLVGYIDQKGSAYVGYVFIGSGSNLDFDWGSLDADGLIGALLLSQEGLREALPKMSEMPEGLEKYLELLPSTLMVVAYVDVNPEETAQRSEGVSSAFDDLYGVDLQQFMSFDPSTMAGNMSLPDINLVVYQSTAELDALADSYLDYFEDFGGLAELMREATDNGRLIPGSSPELAQGSMFLTGFINMDTVASYFPMDDVLENVTEFLPPIFEGVLSFSGGASYWERGFVSEGEMQAMDIIALLGVEESVEFSEDSDMSIMLLTMPFSNDTEGAKAKLTTSLPLDDPRYDLINSSLYELGLLNTVAPGESIDEASFQLQVSDLTLPLNVRVTREISSVSVFPNDDVRVTVTVSNDDEEPMTEVFLTDHSAASGYVFGTWVVSGSTSDSWEIIGPGQSRSLSYDLHLGPSGTYTLSPVGVVYEHGGMAFTASSGWSVVSVSHPNSVSLLLMSLGSSLEAATSALDMITNGSGTTILGGSALLLLALWIFLQYRAFKGWIAG